MEDHLIVNGQKLETPARVVTWQEDGRIVHFSGDRRQPSRVSEIVIHESVTSSVQSTERVLLNRGLGVHLIVSPEGRVTQHADLGTARLCHAGGHNGCSVAIEVVNPYYGSKGASLPWTRVIDAAWADKGKYIVPTIEQCLAVSNLIQTITTTGMVPRHWVGWKNNTLAMSKLPADRQSRTPGIWAHTYFAHADGAFLILYTILHLEHGLSSGAAYERAIQLASTQQKTIQL